MSTVDDTRVRAWLRAPVDGFVEQFADDGPFGGLTQWVRATSPALDLHLWSDAPAGVHRARVVSGTVGLIDVVWSPGRFQLAPRRPFTRTAAGWLDDSWYPMQAAPTRVLRAIAFGESARETAARRARFGVAALGSLSLVTQEYGPLLTTPLDSTPEVAAVREALLPPAVPGGSPFFSVAPDAVALAADGVLEFVRVYSQRAPELRFAAAQAVIDLGLHAGLDPSPRAQQRAHFARLSAVRRDLGLPAAGSHDVDTPVRALVVLEAESSPRLRAQFEAVRDRLLERGVLEESALLTREIPAAA